MNEEKRWWNEVVAQNGNANKNGLCAACAVVDIQHIELFLSGGGNVVA